MVGAAEQVGKGGEAPPFLVPQASLAPLDELAASGLTPLRQGNVSIRSPSGEVIAVSPHGKSLNQLRADQLIYVDAAGRTIHGCGQPTFELLVHLEIYRVREDVHAIVHTEPAFVNVLASVGQELQPVTTLAAKSLGGPVSAIGPMDSGTAACARATVAALGNGRAVIWRRHGLIVVGPTVRDVVDWSIGIEYGAHVQVMANLVRVALGSAHE